MEAETIIFFGCNKRRITSSTVVLRTADILSDSVLSGVYPVIKKWRFGVGINGAIKPIKSLFMYDGYLNVVVLTDIIVETNSLICENVGLSILSLSTAILFNAVLSEKRIWFYWKYRFQVWRLENEIYFCIRYSKFTIW